MARHLPVGVAGMRIVSKFKADGPATIDAILNLRADLVVREVGQERECALGDAHCSSLQVEFGSGSFRCRCNGHEVWRVRGCVVEGDVSPGIERLLERQTMA